MLSQVLAVVSMVIVAPCVIAQEASPPSSLPDHLHRSSDEAREGDRRNATLEQVLAGIAPYEHDADAGALAEVLPDQVTALLDQSRELATQGRAFESGQILRQALRILPESPAVNRALGFALANNGHRASGRRYLQNSFDQNPHDIEVGLSLIRMAQDQREWEVSLSLCVFLAQRLEDNPAPDPQAILNYTQAIALERMGYLAAAAASLEHAIAITPPEAPREIANLVAPSSDMMRMLLGDLHWQLGNFEQASKAYAQVDDEKIAEPGALFARRVYIRVHQSQHAAAIEEVAGFLASPLSRPEDADLVRYLVQSGAAAQDLALALEAKATDGSPSLALIVGLSEFVLPTRTAELLDQWLATRPLNMTRFRAAVNVLRRSGTEDDEPESLCHAILLVAQASAARPEQSKALIQSLTDSEIDPAAMIRALRRPEIVGADAAIVHRVAGQLYRSVGRNDEAEEALSQSLALDETDVVAKLLLAEVFLETQQPARVAALLGEPSADMPWHHFELSVAAIAQNSQLGTALSHVSRRLEEHPEDIRLRIAHANFLAATATKMEAVEELLAVIREYPGDERAYSAGLAIIFATREVAVGRGIDPRGPWAKPHRELMQGLATYLPQSRTLRYYRVEQWFLAIQFERAIPVLRQMVEADPSDMYALNRLSLLLEVSGHEDEADELLARYNALLPPGVVRQIRIAEQLFSQGQAEDAASLIYKVLAEDEEGVMPGPAMSDIAASGLLNILILAEGLEAAEPYFLAMLRRFPNSVTLNNGLGYRWAVAGKELASARLMIQRAIDIGGENDAVLDSMAWVLYRMGEFELARANMQQAITLQQRRNRSEPASRALYGDHMGDILFALGDVDSARAQWTSAQLIASISLRHNPLDDEEIVTLEERLGAKLQALLNGDEVPVSPVLGEAAMGRGGHPADWE